MHRSRVVVLLVCVVSVVSTMTGCASTPPSTATTAAQRPNIILVMADDLGYGDLGYMGNATVKTPCLDAMAAEAVRLDRFYAAAPVCSPTRASCLTGRHPYRMNIPWASDGILPAEEVTLAEMLRDVGYRTGHFGKWHLGGLSKTVKQSYFPGPVDPAEYAPPWEHGFDECFTTESMMPTYNPYYHVGGEYGTDDYRHVQRDPVALGQTTDGFRWRDYYWTGPGQFVDEWLEGDDAALIMDRALDFIGRNLSDDAPFLSVIWFHTPHTPVVAGDGDRAPYGDLPMDGQHWFGSIAAMDRQIGRLRDELRRLGIADDTLVWFCSDNGPSYIHEWGSTAGLRGQKSELYEGGVRVPAIVEWPARFGPRTVAAPMSTSDFLPTVQAILGIAPDGRPLDGADVLPLLEGGQSERGNAIAFQSPLRGQQWEKQEGEESMALVGDRFKILSVDGGDSFQLYDLAADPAETTDVSPDHPAVVAEMREDLAAWMASCANSARGADY